ncbi:HTH-type transcriptional regulator GltC [Caprobacter fermentans]|uniref:HTH-type transcriptional regulator GltC n=2 Tax=Caproicibacter fermentans TaxID=2576756 RepID=A0A6N8I483_9FIRM|nr:HTH-type transcriptional regulator GltC [Caproicibacter fermentans]
MNLIMDINKYAIFMLAAETGGITRAARELNYTQTAASHMLASLEAELGAQLLERSPRGVTLTPMGGEVLPFARQIVEADREIRRLTPPDSRQKGLIRIGAITSVAVRWLPEVLVSFRKKYPDVEIQLNDAMNYEAIQDWFERGLIDCAFTADSAIKGIRAKRLCCDPLLVILPKSHPLCRYDRIPPALLAGETFIIPSEGTHHTVGMILRQAKGHALDPGKLSDQAAIAMVRKGCGVSILPQLVLNCYSCEGIERRGLDPERSRTICLATPEKKPLSPILTDLIRSVQSCAGSLSSQLPETRTTEAASCR